MDKAVAQDIGPWKNMIRPDDFKNIAKVASDEHMTELWKTIAMTMAERCIGLQNSVRVYQDRVIDFEQRLNRVDQTANTILEDNRRLKEENEKLKAEKKTEQELERKSKLPDAQDIARDAFTHNESISHSYLIQMLQMKGEFTIDQAEHLIGELLREGYMYEYKTGFYKKA